MEIKEIKKGRFLWEGYKPYYKTWTINSSTIIIIIMIIIIKIHSEIINNNSQNEPLTVNL